jgi:hypothetical protein
MTDPKYNTDLDPPPADVAVDNKGEPTILVSTTTTTMADEKVAVIDDGISHHPSKKSRKNDDNCDDIIVKDEKKDSDNDEHDDDDEMMNILVPSGMIIHEDEEDDLHHVIIPQKPLDNLLKVDDEAILDCWNLSIASHEAASMILLEKEYRWKESIIDDPNDNDDKQQNSKLVIDAKLLTLPSWAVDPFDMSKLNCE